MNTSRTRQLSANKPTRTQLKPDNIKLSREPCKTITINSKKRGPYKKHKPKMTEQERKDAHAAAQRKYLQAGRTKKAREKKATTHSSGRGADPPAMPTASSVATPAKARRR